MVEAGGKSGVVEELTLRYLRLRDYSGNVHFVPNNTISTVTNMSMGFAYAVIDAGVAYGENVDRVIAVMRTVGEATHIHIRHHHRHRRLPARRARRQHRASGNEPPSCQRRLLSNGRPAD